MTDIPPEEQEAFMVDDFFVKNMTREQVAKTFDVPVDMIGEPGAHANAEEDWTQKNAIVMRVSREMALDYGLVEPTPEEWAAMQDDRRRFRRHQRDQWAQWLKTKEQLDSVTEPMARMVLDLHTPEDDVCGLVCTGCDYEGFEGEPPAYPCRTVQLIATHQQIDLPTYIGSRPPDDDSDLDQPWRKREPIHTLFPSAFTNANLIDYGKLKDDDMEDKR